MGHYRDDPVRWVGSYLDSPGVGAAVGDGWGQGEAGLHPWVQDSPLEESLMGGEGFFTAIAEESHCSIEISGRQR